MSGSPINGEFQGLRLLCSIIVRNSAAGLHTAGLVPAGLFSPFPDELQRPYTTILVFQSESDDSLISPARKADCSPPRSWVQPFRVVGGNTPAEESSWLGNAF